MEWEPVSRHCHSLFVGVAVRERTPLRKLPHDQGDAKGRRKTFHGARAQHRRKETAPSVANPPGSRANAINLLSPGLSVNPLPILDSHVSILAPPHTFSFVGTSRNDAHAVVPSRGGGEYVDSDDTLCNDVNIHPLPGIGEKQANQGSLYKSRDTVAVSPMFTSKSIAAEDFGATGHADERLERASKRRKLQDYANPMKEMVRS
jgi:hypothetical protein